MLPWWGWVLIALAVIVIVPVKFKILNKILEKSRQKNQAVDED